MDKKIDFIRKTFFIFANIKLKMRTPTTSLDGKKLFGKCIQLFVNKIIKKIHDATNNCECYVMIEPPEWFKYCPDNKIDVIWDILKKRGGNNLKIAYNPQSTNLKISWDFSEDYFNNYNL